MATKWRPRRSEDVVSSGGGPCSSVAPAAGAAGGAAPGAQGWGGGGTGAPSMASSASPGAIAPQASAGEEGTRDATTCQQSAR